MRLTLDEARKFISGKQRKWKPPKMYVLSIVEKDLLGTRVQVDLPIETIVPLNVREHWRTTHSRKKKQQLLVEKWAHAFKHVRKPEAVGLVRISPGKLDDDNLHACFKHIRDAIARVYETDDADWKEGSLSWTYAQMSMGRLYGVRIAVVGSLI